MFGSPIEQAIFTSLRGRTMDGYQVAAASRGVTADEARELAVWGPGHESLLDPRPGAQSVNFHRLESGRFCVSLTTALDAEYSGRGGCQLYTHILVVSAETLARFANDPFRLLEAALATGKLEPLVKVPGALESLALVGSASAVNGALLARVARDPGAPVLARLVEAALRHRVVAVAADSRLPPLLAAFLNLLPIECRTDFSFTTGLRHSARRPYRISPLSDDEEERRRTIKAGGATALELNAAGASSTPTAGWAGYVYRVLHQNQLSQFAAALRQSRPNLTCGQLDSLAQTLASSTRPAVAAIN